MKNWFFNLLAGSSLLFLTGCSMCCGQYDYYYPTYGGITERADPEWGRVGSRFSDANFSYVGPSADSNLEHVEPKKIRRSIGEGMPDGFDDAQPPSNEDTLPMPGDLERPPATQPPNLDEETTADRIWRNRQQDNTQGWR